MPGPIDLHALDPHALVMVAGLLVLFQTALVVGFLVPAGKAAVLTGVLAGVGSFHVVLAWSVMAVAAIVGAEVGYLLGRRHGTALFEHQRLDRHRDRLDRAADLVRRRAGFALVAGRSLAVFRATTPALAGAAGVGSARFLVFNVLGGLLWATLYVGSGYAGAQLLPALSWNRTTALAVAGAVAVLMSVLVLRRRRSAQESAHSAL